MGTKNIQNIILLVLYTCLVACVKDKPGNTSSAGNPVATDTAERQVYVVCEGSLGNGDGSLYLYDVKSGAVSGDVFASTNAGGKLGDVFQSMTRIGDRYFLCINNSDKIVVLNRSDKKVAGNISVPKPRYILPISDTKAYVSGLFSNKVYIINPQTMQVAGTIDMPYQNPEGMRLYNGKVYVCTWDTACSRVYTINTTTDAVETSIPVSGAAPQEALEDAQGRLWILSGNVSKNKSSSLTVIDKAGNIVRSYHFPDKADVIRPVFNPTLDSLYFIEVNYSGGNDYNGIYRMSINDADVPSVPFIAAQAYQYFWALGIDPKDGKIYIGDPKGFIQKGSVSVYKQDGTRVTSFPVGLGPGHFYFD